MSKAFWRFAPTSGGAEQSNSAGQQSFAVDRVTKMVRETLQNSLDHPTPGFDTVCVDFSMFEVPRDLIAAEQLAEHYKSARVEIESQPAVTRRYDKAIALLNRPTLPCLSIIDSFTTGLRGDNWDNLVIREGMPSAGADNAKGGSFGFGKNAPFNLSELNCVFYSTRYLDTAIRGRMERLAGRVHLVSHNAPSDGKRLQHIGFYATHEETKPNNPLVGQKIPPEFRLNENGTGIFIVGFNTAYRNWVDEAAKACVRHFFYAIHQGRLKVTFTDSESESKRIISKETLAIEMDNLPPKDPCRSYYEIIQDSEPYETTASGNLEQLGKLLVWVGTDETAPKRTAHINTRGMLITDARQFNANPFYPARGAGGWLPWTAVTMAADDDTDRNLRRLEPPAHDALHYKQLDNPDEVEQVHKELRFLQEEVRRIVQEIINSNVAANKSNVEELAELFPDLPKQNKGTQDFNFHETKPSKRLAEGSVVEYNTEQTTIIGDSDNDDYGDGGSNYPQEYRSAESKSANSQDNETSEDNSSKPSASKGGQGAGVNALDHSIANSRVLRTAPDEISMAFSLKPDHNDLENGSRIHKTVRFTLKPAGEQYQHGEIPLNVTAVAIANRTAGSEAVAEDPHTIRVTAMPNERLRLRISIKAPTDEYTGYILTEVHKNDHA